MLTGRLAARLRPLLAPLAADDAVWVGNDGLGWLTPAERLRWARVVDRWEHVRTIAPDGWDDLDAFELAYRTALLLTADGTRAISRYADVATRYERDGIHRVRPLAIVVRTLHRYTRDLARIGRERRERARLHAAAATTIQPPPWLVIDRNGHACWRTDSQHLVLRARYLPDDRTLESSKAAIRGLILAHPSPCHGEVPTSILIADRHGDAVRLPLRAARSNEDPPPRALVRLPRPVRRTSERRAARSAVASRRGHNR